MEELDGSPRTYVVMLIVVAAVAVVWAAVVLIVWAACMAASHTDGERLASSAGARRPERPAPEAAERLTVWESLPGLTVGKAKLSA